MAAAGLLVIGLTGMRSPMVSTGVGVALGPKPDLAVADADVERREFMLQQRRDAEALLEQFIRGQMTRHYWGHFAGSLTELGLSSGKHLEATVTSTAAGSGLLLKPRRGEEAYGAGVRQRGSRVIRWQCRGQLPTQDESLSFLNGCPKGWQQIAFK